MIKNKEDYDNTLGKNKDHFYEIKGTPFIYHRRSSRKVLFQCLTTLLKDKIIPFSVYFTYKPSL